MPATLNVSGSSPPARGSDFFDQAARKGGRFIPACAGIGAFHRAACLLQPVHPRLRGDRIHRLNNRVVIGGSSPPARGSGLTPGRVEVVGRFIPACAGIGDCYTLWHRLRTVHPRLRGDRVRAAHYRCTHHRFIPACAGIGERVRSRSP